MKVLRQNMSTKDEDKIAAKRRLAETEAMIQSVGDIGDGGCPAHLTGVRVNLKDEPIEFNADDVPDSDYVAPIPDLGDLPLDDIETEPDDTMFFRRSLFSVSAVKSASVGEGAIYLIISIDGGQIIYEHFDTNDEAIKALTAIKKAKGWALE
jgi:hypothetical protein